jgi:hypothetical protein
MGQWDYSTRRWRESGRVKGLIEYDPLNCSSLETLASFLQRPDHANGMDNRMTRMLAGAKLEVGLPDLRPIDHL